MQIFIFVIGFTAQLLFFTRFLVQWILSEKARRVLSPALFWQLSILASFLLFVYGWLRDDFAILLGQLLAYYIYIWNLKIKNNWKQLIAPVRFIVLVTPFLAIGWLIANWQETAQRLFFNESIPLRLLIWGSLGQLLFTLRFIYQWFYSRKREESLLPGGFWMISIAGALVILSYAIYRRDPVLLIGQGTGILVYSRNLFILKRSEDKS